MHISRKKVLKSGGTNICCDISKGDLLENKLISIGKNVTISSEVIFVTHDNSCIKINPLKSNLFGRINIGDNCFIGQRSTILYGVTLANNIIVASGSVVTRSFDIENIIIGGNPAKIITTWDAYESKNSDYMMTRADFSEAMAKSDESRFVTKPPRREIQ